MNQRDIVTLTDQANYEITPEGWLRAFARVCRTGLQRYVQPDGSTLIHYRPPEEVFAPESLESYRLRPVVSDHPDVPEKMLTACNATEFVVGAAGEQPEQDGEYIRLPLVVYDADAVRGVLDGTKREISVGYTCEFDRTPGTYQGQSYDLIQRNIRANHIALVAVGRAGPEARVLLDASEQGEQMEPVKLKVGEAEFEVAPEVAEAMGAVEAKLVEAQAKIAELEQELAKLNADSEESEAEEPKEDEKVADTGRVELEAEIARLKAQIQAVTDASDRMVAERVRHAAVASRLGIEDAHLMPVPQIQRAVIRLLDSVEVAADRSDEYVAGRYDAALDKHSAQNRMEQIKNPAGPRDELAEAKKARSELNRTGWTRPL